MRIHLRWAFVLAIVVALASASGVLAARHGTDRPWMGQAVGETWFDLENPKGCEAGITTRVDEPAWASHFGPSFLVMAHCPTGVLSDNFADADFTLTAANGDSIYGTYVGRLDVYDDTVIGSEMAFTLYLTITGGDGRFEGASGSAVASGGGIFEGYEDFSWAWWISWQGTIDY